MGGYGVLSAAGAPLDPESPVTRMVPGGLLMPYVRGGRSVQCDHGEVPARCGRHLPRGGRQPRGVGLGRPAEDPRATAADRRQPRSDHRLFHRSTCDLRRGGECRPLSVDVQGRRSCARDESCAAVDAGSLWDQDWFEDPVWRKERISAINAHFITAFLDRYCEGRCQPLAYLEVATPTRIRESGLPRARRPMVPTVLAIPT